MGNPPTSSGGPDAATPQRCAAARRGPHAPRRSATESSSLCKQFLFIFVLFWRASGDASFAALVVRTRRRKRSAYRLHSGLLLALAPRGLRTRSRTSSRGLCQWFFRSPPGPKSAGRHGGRRRGRARPGWPHRACRAHSAQSTQSMRSPQGT